jgi:CcmD family protein
MFQPAPPDTALAPGALRPETATTEIPTAPPVGLERQMVQHDKLFVVVAVVLVIWLGLLLFLFRTDRRLARVERDLRTSADPTP